MDDFNDTECFNVTTLTQENFTEEWRYVMDGLCKDQFDIALKHINKYVDGYDFLIDGSIADIFHHRGIAFLAHRKDELVLESLVDKCDENDIEEDERIYMLSSMLLKIREICIQKRAAGTMPHFNRIVIAHSCLPSVFNAVYSMKGLFKNEESEIGSVHLPKLYVIC